MTDHATSRVQRIMRSPIGPLRLVADASALRGLYFEDHRGDPPQWPAARGPHHILDGAIEQLTEYFAGQRQAFTIPTADDGTEFQRAVWAALRTIPFGQRCSYSELATQLGRPSAVRAVASANARNPLSLFVPCHRVVGKGGTLNGYAGGLSAKRWLLEHEQSA